MEKLIKYEKIFVLFAALPFAYLAFLRLPYVFNSFAIMTAFINSTLIVLFTIFRHKPVDVTVRGRDWLVSFLANASSFLPFFFGAPGLQIISTTQSGVLSLVSLILMILARIHIGRNIGFVPAKRNQIVQGSIYKFIRHPIYAAVTLNLISWLLSRFSFTNFCITFFIIFLFCLKTYCEEQYLMKFSEYVDYAQRVKYRFIPFVF